MPESVAGYAVILVLAGFIVLAAVRVFRKRSSGCCAEEKRARKVFSPPSAGMDRDGSCCRKDLDIRG